MKFKLKLDESLFDDEIDSFITKDTSVFADNVDDDFSEYDNEHSIENVLPGPSEGADTGVAQEIIALINDEWEAIQGYNNAIATLRSAISENSFYADAVKVLEEISAEENAHVGQLQELLKHVSPNAAEIQKGTKEAKNQLGLVGGRLMVQSWDSVSNNTQPSSNDVEVEKCTIDNVDDDM